ncbi:PilZ domain-containing protein [bacterium]|nr:MAG: PilZ domain-containing protein [bacterium]
MKNRAYKRFETGSHCDIECAISHKVKIKNISMGGICLETSRYIETKSTYDMKIVTKKSEEAILKGEVVWSSLKGSIKDKEDVHPVYDIGLKFIEQGDDKKIFLENLTQRLAH